MVILAAGLLMVQPAAAQTNKQQKKENKAYQKQNDEARKSLVVDPYNIADCEAAEPTHSNA